MAVISYYFHRYSTAQMALIPCLDYSNSILLLFWVYSAHNSQSFSKGKSNHVIPPLKSSVGTTGIPTMALKALWIWYSSAPSTPPPVLLQFHQPFYYPLNADRLLPQGLSTCCSLACLRSSFSSYP